MQHDWLDYVSALSGLLGALLAALAIAYAAWQSAETKRQLVRERRLEFELGLLAEIRRQMSLTEFKHLNGYVGALIADPDDETELPVLRALLAVKDGPRGRAQLAKLDADIPDLNLAHDALMQTTEAEVDAAITRRLTQR